MNGDAIKRRCAAPIGGSYDPPRARAWNGWFYLWDELRQSLLFKRLRPAGSMKAWDVAAGLFYPGYALGAMGWKWMGRIALGGYALAWLAFLAWMGQGWSHVAFGLVLSIHAMSILGLLAHQFGPFGLRARIVLVPTILAGLYLVAYRPALDWFYARWAMPVLVRERVLVLQPGISGTLSCGDTVAYSFNSVNGDGYYVQGGLGLDDLLAQAGDRVDFFPDRYEVNGVPAPKRPLMPENGQLVVPQNHWLIWPDLGMVIRNGAAASASKALMQVAVVPEAQLIGKPYRHWFGRTQQP